MIHTKIILASASPRRKELLGSLLRNFGLSFEVIPAKIDEVLPKVSKNPARLVCGLSKHKADYIASRHDGVVIGADTIVVINNNVLGKPASKSEAKKMLNILSGNYHFVYTGLTISNIKQNKYYTAFERTKVIFRKLTGKEIEFYINTGSPFDKAGAYGIQDDFGSTFVSSINGDFFNVVGLPIVKTYLGLKRIINLGN